MYGPGAPPPIRSENTIVTLRVLFTAAGLLTCGFLSCVPLFRVAMLRGRWFNWTAAWVSLPLSIVCFAVVGTVKESDTRGNIALVTVMILGALSSVYFLVMDIRSVDGQRRQYAGYAPAQAPNMPSGYGYPPQPMSPYAAMPTGPQPPMPAMPHTPIPQPPVSPGPGPVPPPPAQRPAPARIDQVRAELDELSDYLRKHDGNGHAHGNHEGGR
ncbi:hypothetical protein ACFYXF_26255 [Streptomyces sp. NPDC002680]|uniref:hypothetical protein n=1 Tax=Streptomyces sp. NPDC002680 TaxID=3364659 RepID=UPI003675EF81